MGPRRYKRDTTAGNRALTTTYGYDALNRLVSAHREGVGVNTTCTYQYDSLGNLIRQEQDGCEEYRYNGYQLDESKECGVIGTCRWEYTYDGRGNLISEDKYTRTTTGMDWQNVATYVYDETNRLVDGRNEQGERSLYTYNGLGVRVGRELIVQDNTHGYTDFHSGTPSVETGIDKPEVVKESYVVDYTTATRETLTMTEEGGFAYRWVYGLDKLSVKITSEGTNWWGQNVKQDILKDYTHQDRLGSTTNLTDKFGRVVGRADYNEWGEMTYREALSITSSYRRIWPQSSYTGHDWDDVLGMYYAKARFYSAEDKRFVAMDPVKGSVTDPMSLVAYVYCVDNPLRYTDPLGLVGYEMLNTIGFLLSAGMPNEAAVGAIMLGGNAWYSGHQLAQAFMYKWLMSRGYTSVELEYTMPESDDRADVIAWKGLSVELFELKHRSSPNSTYAEYPHAAEQRKLGESQLKKYFDQVKCYFERNNTKNHFYSIASGGFSETFREKLFTLSNGTAWYINMQSFPHLNGNYVEYYYSYENPKKQKQEAPAPSFVLQQDYDRYRVEQHNKQLEDAIYRKAGKVAGGILITIGVISGATVVGVAIYVAGPAVAAKVASSISGAVAGLSMVAAQTGEFIYQHGAQIIEYIQRPFVPVPGRFWW